MDLFSIDDKNPLLPTSATEFAGQFDPVVAMNSGLDYVANELGLYKWEPLLVPYVQEYMPSYFQGKGLSSIASTRRNRGCPSRDELGTRF